MIYRVVIIDNGNQVSLELKDNPIKEAWPPIIMTLEGNPSNETREIMEHAIDILKEADLDETDDN